VVSLVVSFLLPVQQLSFARPGSDPGAYAADLYPSAVETVFNGAGSERIFHIKDAHSSLSGQYSMIEVLDRLKKTYDVDIIATEGAEGEVDTSILKSFPDGEIRNRKARSLMKKGLMGAGEVFSIINGGKDVLLFGAEDADLYWENLEQFREMFGKDEAVRRIKSRLWDTAEKIYPGDVLGLIKASFEHRAGKKPFSEYVVSLQGFAARTNNSLLEYPELSLIKHAMELEGVIDFDRANSERYRLFRELNELGDVESLRSLVEMTVAYRKGRVPAYDYYHTLLSLAEKNGVEPGAAKDLREFAEYVRIYENIDLAALQSEFAELEEDILNCLLISDEQYRFYCMLSLVHILERAVTASISRREYIKLKHLLNEYSREDLLLMLTKYVYGDVPGRAASHDLEMMFLHLKAAADFYGTAFKRERAMIRNTLKKMKDKGKKAAVLITGGFHSAGLTDILKRENISYMVIAPDIGDDSERPYVAVLSAKRKRPRASGSASASGIMVASYSYSLGTREFKDLVVELLAEAKAGGLGIQALKEQWDRSYRKFYIPSAGNNRLPPGSFSKFLSDLDAVSEKEKIVVLKAGAPLKVYVREESGRLKTADPGEYGKDLILNRPISSREAVVMPVYSPWYLRMLVPVLTVVFPASSHAGEPGISSLMTPFLQPLMFAGILSTAVFALKSARYYKELRKLRKRAGMMLIEAQKKRELRDVEAEAKASRRFYANTLMTFLSASLTFLLGMFSGESPAPGVDPGSLFWRSGIPYTLMVVFITAIIVKIWTGIKNFKIRAEEKAVEKDHRENKKHLRVVPSVSSGRRIKAAPGRMDLVLALPLAVYNRLDMECGIDELVRETGIDRFIPFEKNEPEVISGRLEKRTKGVKTICTWIDEAALRAAGVFPSGGDIDIEAFKKIASRFTHQAEKDIIRLTMPEIYHISSGELRAMISERGRFLEVFDIYMRTLPRESSLGLAVKGIYDLRIDTLNRKILNEYIPGIRAAKFLTTGARSVDRYFISIDARDAADLRMLASSLEQMNIGREKAASFLHIRIDSPEINSKNIKKYVRASGLCDYLPYSNISVIEGDPPALSGVLDLVRACFDENIRPGSVAIGSRKDLIRDKTDLDVLEKKEPPLYIQMKGGGTSSSLMMALIEAMASPGIIPPSLGTLKKVRGYDRWFVYIPKVDPLDMELLKREKENYAELIRSL
jgi:hypothetical protein